MSKIILASKSPYRSTIMKNAGITFDVHTANIDEREIERPLLKAGLDGADIADILAVSKATNISNSYPGDYIIGSDQTLSLDGELLHKPENLEDARRRLLALSGRSHELNSAVCIVKDGITIWNHTDRSIVYFRKLDPGFIGRHIANVGEIILSSVGAYQIEGQGIQLFEKIEGDFFSVMGMPILPLLKELRRLKLVDG